MCEYLVDTNVLPNMMKVSIKEFAVEKVTRCEDCIWYDEGYCHVWEAETIPDGWCYQGDESDEDMKERLAYVSSERLVCGAA